MWMCITDIYGGSVQFKQNHTQKLRSELLFVKLKVQKKKKMCKHTQAEFTILILAFSLLGAQGPLGGLRSSQDLGTLGFHLETAEGQTAEALSLTGGAVEAGTTTLLLKGCKKRSESYCISEPSQMRRDDKFLPCSCFFNSSI